MRPPLPPSVVRLRVQPDEPEAVTAPRPHGSRRPHTDAKVAAVRRLIEHTTLTYGAIAARSGVGRASICRWTRDGGWKRPPFAPRATDTVPTARASAQLKARLLCGRLRALAERHIRELEAAPTVDFDRLTRALALLKMATLAARPRRRARPDTDAILAFEILGDRGQADLVADLRALGINITRASPAALVGAVWPPQPPCDETGSRRRSRREEEHARMLEPER